MTYVNQARQLGNVGVLDSFRFGGSISGYYMCGTNHHDAWCGGCGTGQNYYFNDIWSISLTTDGNAVDTGGSMGGGYTGGTGCSSTTHGYWAGAGNQIEKFSFTNPGAGFNDVGDLAASLTGSTGGNSSATNGYVASHGNIYRFSFATDGGGPDVGNLTTNRTFSVGSNSSTHGYQSGGTNSNVIDKFAFANEATANDVGDLPSNLQDDCGASSETHGYHFGRGQIYRYSFSADGNATDVGNLGNSSGERGTGISSLTHGYACGGSVHETNMEKFSFANHTSTTVGNLGTGQTTNRYAGATNQY